MAERGAAGCRMLRFIEIFQFLLHHDVEQIAFDGYAAHLARRRIDCSVACSFS